RPRPPRRRSAAPCWHGNPSTAARYGFAWSGPSGARRRFVEAAVVGRKPLRQLLAALLGVDAARLLGQHAVELRQLYDFLQPDRAWRRDLVRVVALVAEHEQAGIEARRVQPVVDAGILDGKYIGDRAIRVGRHLRTAETGGVVRVVERGAIQVGELHA